VKANPEQLKFLQQFINKINPLKDEAWIAFSDIWEAVMVKRKSIIRSPGETEKNLYFVLEGVQRAYHRDDAGNELTIEFTYPYSFPGDSR
jgi:CRP-like cAMP-binding protein